MVDLALIVWLSFGCNLSCRQPVRLSMYFLIDYPVSDTKKSNHFTVDSQGDTMACDVAGVNSHTVCCGVSS